MDCPLVANPLEFITRGPSMSMRSPQHKMNISRTTVRKDVVGGLEVQILWYEKRSILLEAGKRMQEWLKENLPMVLEKEVWPPSSPNYNLLDYFVSGVSGLLVNAQPHIKIEGRIQKMKAVIGSLDRGTVAKAYQRLMSKIEAVMAADSHFIESLDS